jgi:hypothetical protein
MGRKKTSPTYNDECYLAARKFFDSEVIKDKDLKRIVEDIREKQKEYGIEGGDVVKFKSKSHRMRVLSVMDARAAVMGRVRRLVAERQAKSFVNRPEFVNDKMKAFIAKFEYIPEGVEGSHNGFWINQETNMKTMGRALDSFAEDADILRKGELDIEIADATYKLRKGESLDGLHPDAVRIGKKLNQYNNWLLNHMRESGIDIKYREDFIVRQTHDWEKVGAVDFKEWKKFLDGHIDHDATFKDVAGGKAERDKILQSIYQDITQGGYGQGVGNFGGQRSIIFKDGRSFGEYNKKFGRDNLMETVIASSRSSARASALAQTFGDLDVEKLWGDMELEAKKSLSGEALAKFERQAEKRKIMLDTMLGRSSDGPHEMLGKITRGTLSVQRMALLNNVALSTLPDLATTVGNMVSVTGMGRTTAYLQAMGDFVSSLPTAERKKWLGYFEESIDSVIESNYQRFGLGLDEPGGKFFRGAEEKYFRLVGLTQQTQAAKLANKRMLSRAVADLSDKGFEELPGTIKRSMDRVGITKKDWDVMKSHAREVDGKKYILPTDMPTDAMKQKVSKYFIAVTKGGVIEGGAMQHLALTGGKGASDPHGAGMRLLTQFLSFSMAIPRTMRQMKYSGEGMKANNFYEMVAGRGAASNVMRTAVDGMILGVAIQYITDLAKGKHPDLSDPEAYRNLALRGMQRGAMPILGQYFIDAAEGDLSLERLAGPTFSQIPAMGKILETTFEGDIGEALARTAKQGVRNLPGQNSILLKPIINKLFLTELNEVISPGYQKRMEKRVKKQGSEILFDTN